ncbi:MAG: efflux RND transporter periplasmic adaptor subunit [Pseudomonadota bacterium]|nr:efflux RND transporter periplasmic adaptor subunit [Pseudomonadota bacterium]
MKTSIIFAGLLAIAASGWIISGQMGNTDKIVVTNDKAAQKLKVTNLISVRVKRVQRRTRPNAVILNGRTEESRKVILRAETTGSIINISGKEGRMVEVDEIIARQNIEDRNALLAEASALVKQREIEFVAAQKLAQKGFRSGTKLAEARALLDAARARAKTIRIDLSKTTITAPFGGVLEVHYVEKGDFVKIGDNIAKIVDLDPILAVGFISEKDIDAIKIGGRGHIKLTNGRTANGTVRFIGSVADSATRSFRVELQIPNSDYKIRSGLTGELTLLLKPIQAHVVSPAVITLADDGRIGVRIVDDDNIVRFVKIKILSDSAEGLWVSGLKDGQRLITVGHEYVKAGQLVRPTQVKAKLPL